MENARQKWFHLVSLLDQQFYRFTVSWFINEKRGIFLILIRQKLTIEEEEWKDWREQKHYFHYKFKLWTCFLYMKIIDCMKAIKCHYCATSLPLIGVNWVCQRNMCKLRTSIFGYGIYKLHWGQFLLHHVR